MSASNPKTMTVSHPGKVVRSPEGVATAPFWVEMLLEGADGENTAMRATLDPGTITRWHTHPKGQTLYVTDGIGLVCRRGGEPTEMRPGDVVFIEPNEEHWHGATPQRFMAHVAIQQADEQGQTVTWLDPVADDEYEAR